MEENSTHLITYRELQKCEPDIYSDAFGLDALAAQLLTGIHNFKCTPDDRVISDLFDKIRNDAKVH